MKKKAKKKRKKRTAYQIQKDKTWRAFSRMIRIRDCLKTASSDAWGLCVTCGKQHDIRDLQAGHYIPGRKNAILFDERGVHAQCRGCNIWGRGQPQKFHAFMLGEYGQEVIDELVRQANTRRKFTEGDLAEMAAEFTRRTEEMEEAHGL